MLPANEKYFLREAPDANQCVTRIRLGCSDCHSVHAPAFSDSTARTLLGHMDVSADTFGKLTADIPALPSASIHLFFKIVLNVD